MPPEVGHFTEGMRALPDFAWLVESAMANATSSGERAEIEESIDMFEEWVSGRSLYPTL